MTGKILFGHRILITIAVLLMAGGNAIAQQQDLSGVWEFQGGGDSIRMDLRPNATFEWNSYIQGTQQYFNGSWSFSGGYLNFTPVQTNAPEAYPCVFTGANSITVTFNGNPVAMRRTSGAPIQPRNQTPAVQGSLKGRWVARGNGTEMVFLLMPDKSFDLTIDQNGQRQHFTGSYSQSNGQIHLRTDGVAGEEVYPLTFNSADSWTGVFEGTPVTFAREGNLPVVRQQVENKPIEKKQEEPIAKPKPQPRQSENPQEDDTPEEDPTPQADPQPQEQQRSAFQGLRPRRPGDAVGNTAGNTGNTGNTNTPQPSGGFLSGGGPAASSVNLTGLWVSSGGNETITMELLNNGSFTYEAKSGGATNSLSGTYSVKDDQLTFTPRSGQVINVPFKMQGDDTLMITSAGTSYTMKRQSSQQQSNSQPVVRDTQNQLVGTWRLTTPQMVITAVLNPDGTYRLEAGAPGENPDIDEGTYTVQGNNIDFKSNTDEPESGTWQMPDRNTLSLNVAGTALTFQRVN